MDVLLGPRGTLCTPPLEERILASITRARLLEECGVTERPCTLDDVRAAEEAFIASTVREVMPIAVIDEIELPSAPGPVTTRHPRALPAPRRARAGGGGRLTSAAAQARIAAARVPADPPQDVVGGADHALYGSADAAQERRHVSRGAIPPPCGF